MATSDTEDTEAEFVFYKSLNAESKKLFANSSKCVSEVVFSVSRYGDNQKQLKFNGMRTVKYAVEFVEKYLSQLITKEYFDANNNDRYKNINEITIRGDLIKGRIFLERLEFTDGVLVLSCGS